MPSPEHLPLSDTDRCFKAVTGCWYICWNFEKEAADSLQRWTKQCANWTCQRAECFVYAWPLDNICGYAMALQVLYIHGHFYRNLVLIRGAMVFGSLGAWGPAWWDICSSFIILLMPFIVLCSKTLSLKLKENSLLCFCCIIFLQILTLHQTTHPVWCKCRLWRGHSSFPWNPRQL